MPTGPPALAMWPAVIPMLHFPGLMMPGQFGPEQLGVGEVALELVEEVGLVVGGHALGDGHDELDAGFGGLEHGSLDAGRGDEDAGGRGAGCRLGLGHRRVDGTPSTSVPAFLGWVPATTWVPYSG